MRNRWVMITSIQIGNDFAKNWTRIFLVMTFLGLEAASNYFVKASI